MQKSDQLIALTRPTIKPSVYSTLRQVTWAGMRRLRMEDIVIIGALDSPKHSEKGIPLWIYQFMRGEKEFREDNAEENLCGGKKFWSENYLYSGTDM